MHSFALFSLALIHAVSGLTIKERQAEVSLDELVEAKGKEYFGTCADEGTLSNEKNAAIIPANFGQVTPENSMKWESLQSTQGSYNWDQADYLVDWATENGQLIRGHTLVWHSQLPDWVENINDPDELTQTIEDHISTVMGRWAGKVAKWDVVNEIFDEDGTLRDSVFSQVLGEDFVGIAFNAAREADPDAKLYINDYNLDSADYAKTQGMADKVSEWLDAGIPIDGIVMDQPPGLKAVELLAGTGISEVALTEMDIADASPDAYVTAVNACMNNEKCVGITVWGVADPDSWRAESTPLLFDDNYEPKEAYDALVQELQ